MRYFFGAVDEPAGTVVNIPAIIRESVEPLTVLINPESVKVPETKTKKNYTPWVIMGIVILLLRR